MSSVTESQMLGSKSYVLRQKAANDRSRHRANGPNNAFGKIQHAQETNPKP